MLNYYILQNNSLSLLSEEESRNDLINPIWIDIFDPTPEEEKLVEKYLKINVPTHCEIAPIELSSHHYQKKDGIYATAAIITDDQEMQTVTFIFTEDKFITLRYANFCSFERFLTYVKTNRHDTLTNIGMFTSLIESIIDQINNSLEEIGHSIKNISSTVFKTKNYSKKKKNQTKLHFKDIINQIGINGDFISNSHESLISIYCALTFISESKQFKFSSQDLEKIHSLMNDISPFKDRASFLSDKINFLLDVCLGMISIEQNKIIKTVSIAALIFFPPTIVASIYGMNFDIMPELKWELGYPFALLLILLSGILPYLYFKRKDWI